MRPMLNWLLLASLRADRTIDWPVSIFATASNSTQTDNKEKIGPIVRRNRLFLRSNLHVSAPRTRTPLVPTNRWIAVGCFDTRSILVDDNPRSVTHCEDCHRPKRRLVKNDCQFIIVYDIVETRKDGHLIFLPYTGIVSRNSATSFLID